MAQVEEEIMLIQDNKTKVQTVRVEILQIQELIKGEFRVINQ